MPVGKIGGMRKTLTYCAIAVALLSITSAAQRRPGGAAAPDQKVGAAIDLRVNGTPYTFKGQAVCHHLAMGSIYDIRAERWSVQQSEADRSAALTLWRPLTGGADMVTLSITLGGKRHDVNTVKSPNATKTEGSGSVRLSQQGGAGTFTVDATAASGAKVTGTIKCDQFTVPEVVAGD